jgi:hypothetical protein
LLIDNSLADIYTFNEDDIDYIRNYENTFRMGKETEDGDETDEL